MSTTEHQTTAALYGRVSQLKDGADRERSVDQQLAENEKAAARHGWTVISRYADPGRSASRFARVARENWERVLAAIRAREFDVLVVWETWWGGAGLAHRVGPVSCGRGRASVAGAGRWRGL